MLWLTVIAMCFWSYNLHMVNTAVTITSTSREKSFGQQQQSNPFVDNNILLKNKMKYSRDKRGRRTVIPQRKYDKVIFFIHIHKSAGSWMCKQAYRNRMSAAYGSNCNVQDDQYCCGENDSIQGLIDFANTTYYDFVATEREMYDAMEPNVYDYVVSLRQSKARYYSHYQMILRHTKNGKRNHENKDDEDSLWLWSGQQNSKHRINPSAGEAAGDDVDHNHPMKKLQQKMARDRLRQQQRKKRMELAKENNNNKNVPPYQPLRDFKTWSSGQPDNWNVRIICGRKCKSSAKFQITPQLFQYTLKRISLFRHILFVENMVESFNTFAEYYGWKREEVVEEQDKITTNHNDEKNSTVSNKKTHRHHHSYYPTLDDTKHLSETEWNPMMSALDDALYEFAKRKYQNNTLGSGRMERFSNQDQVDYYFDMGPKQNCTDICCDQCSPY